jgi:hypothetical protein
VCVECGECLACVSGCCVVCCVVLCGPLCVVRVCCVYVACMLRVCARLLKVCVFLACIFWARVGRCEGGAGQTRGAPKKSKKISSGGIQAKLTGTFPKKGRRLCKRSCSTAILPDSLCGPLPLEVRRPLFDKRSSVPRLGSPEVVKKGNNIKMKQNDLRIALFGGLFREHVLQYLFFPDTTQQRDPLGSALIVRSRA